MVRTNGHCHFSLQSTGVVMLLDTENNELAYFKEDKEVKHLPKKGIVWCVCMIVCIGMYACVQYNVIKWLLLI